MRINENEIEKVHQYFCKRTLNVSKYASKNAVNAELGRCPIMHKAWGLAVEYSLRLENCTENAILNEAFLEAKLLIMIGFKVCNICYVQTVFAIYGSIL